MKRLILFTLSLAVLLGSVLTGAALLTPQTAASKGKEHGFMKDQTECDTCHVVEWKGSVGTMETDQFTNSFVDICSSCHKEHLVRSHPVNVSPYKLMAKEKYPENLLPLQRSDDYKDDVMTCATCHKPHGDRTGRDKLYTRQKEVPGQAGSYLTYFLRIKGATPKEGYAPLCKTCHPKL